MTPTRHPACTAARILAASALIGLALTGCNGTHSHSASHSSKASPSVSSAKPTSLPSVEDAAPDGDREYHQPTTGPGSPSAAQEAALATMNVWVQGQSMDQDAWHAAIMPTLHPGQGQSVIGNTLGWKIPVTKITGPVTVAHADSQYAIVVVPTDAGQMKVTLQTNESGAYLTTAITPVGG